MSTPTIDDHEDLALETLMATSSDAVIISTINGIITGWNPAAEDLYGYSAGEVIGQPITLLIHPDHLNEYPALIERLTRGERIERFETYRRHKDGHLMEVSLLVCPLKNRAGKLVGILSLIHDTLRYAKRFKRFVDANIIGVIIADMSTILEANDIFLAMIGSDRKALAQGNIHWSALLAPEHAPFDQPRLEEMRTRGMCTPFEREYVRQNGTRVPILFGATLLQEEPFQCVCFVLDLTAQKALEQHKSELVTMTSHELRTPLTSIKGYVEVLLTTSDTQLTTEQHGYLEIIQRNVGRLVALVNDLLDLSHLEAGTVQLQRHVLDLGALLQEVVQNFQPQLKAKGQQLSVQVLPSPPVVLGDPSRMLQILTNLLSNAHKFTPPGGNITLSLHQGQETVTIAVQDSGIGMTDAEQSKLFTKFYRAHPFVNGEEGTGMGLVITRALVEMQGGSITVESHLAQGSTFRVSLPIVREMPLNGKGVSKPEGKRILVVEDEPDHSRLVRYLLEQQGHEVLSTYRGEDVVALATRAHPDLILLDVALPTSNGLRVLEQLKRLEATASIPVLLLTITESKEEGVLQGALDVLAKPFSQAQLQQHIATIAQEEHLPLALVTTRDPISRASLLESMHRAGYRVLEADSVQNLLRLVASQRPHLVLLDAEVLVVEMRDLFDRLITQLASLRSALVMLGPLPASLQKEGDELRRGGQVYTIDRTIGVEEALTEITRTLPNEASKEGIIQVLIVDDDPDIVQMLPLLLPEYTFMQVTGGLEALQLMRQNHPDLVLLDWMMPGMNGIQLLQVMKEDAALAQIPVIMLSARYQDAEIQAGLQAGADGYLVKPFNTPDVRLAIAELVTKAKKQS